MRLESSLKDANRQLKSSRNFLGSPDARGLLFLVNDGNLGLHPGLVQNALSRSLHKYSCINTVVHFTANLASTLEPVDHDLLFWCVWSAKRFKPPVDSGFLGKVQRAWFAHHQHIAGRSIPLRDAGAHSVHDLEFIER